MVRCRVCGREFEARRNTAKFCSSTCRSRYNRGVALKGLPCHGHEAICSAVSAAEVERAVEAAHQSASDLSRCAIGTSGELSTRLDAAARGMESALRGQGL